jgi:hypothetical protein
MCVCVFLCQSCMLGYLFVPNDCSSLSSVGVTTMIPFAYADAPSSDRMIHPTMPMYTHNPTFVPEYTTLQELVPVMASEAQMARDIDKSDADRARDPRSVGDKSETLQAAADSSVDT